MIPQCGYYSNGQTGQRNGTYGGRPSTGYGNASRNGSSMRVNPSYTSVRGSQSSTSRMPPVFQQQQMNRNSYGGAAPQQGGGYSSNMPNPYNRNCAFQPCQPQARPIPYSRNNIKMGYQEPQMCATQKPLAPVPFCTPQAIKVNITAEQLQNAQSTPFQDRGEASVEGVPGAKYIQLNWQDLIGGMDNLRVSMNQDPSNPNQQLRVSFGGQKGDPPQAGQTDLKVLSIEPASTGRMSIDQGNALARNMRICNSPITNLCPATNYSPPPRAQTPATNVRYRMCR